MEVKSTAMLRADTSPTAEIKVDNGGHVYAGGDNQDAVSAPPDSKTQTFMEEGMRIAKELGEKRDSDKRLVAEFRTKMREMIDNHCDEIEQKLIARHHSTDTTIESISERLNEIVRRISDTEQELEEFAKAAGMLLNNEGKMGLS